MTVAVESSFERALSAEIMASEELRTRVLATVLGVLLVVQMLILLFADELVTQFVRIPLPVWLPLAVVGPFLAYETAVTSVLRYRRRRGLGMPAAARFGNATIETSLPTVILWVASRYIDPALVLGGWPAMLYFVYIVAATLRLNFALPAYTGAVAAVSYLAVIFALLSPADAPLAVPPINFYLKAAIMLVAGIVAGLVAMRLHAKFRAAMEEATKRERVTSLFGQHVSPAVVERLLGAPAELGGETREICVMFLDIRDFTANARHRPPAEVVAFLNDAFAFMIEAVDRHGGLINKFLGDGFLAIFGAPLADPAAATHAVAAAHDILAEIDRRGLADGAWPLRVGIGLHVGPAVTGNVGSPRRKEFTAIGDTVNLAARFEQLTKEHGARLIVSDAVVRALGEGVGATALGGVAVKGYAEPVPAWRLN